MLGDSSPSFRPKKPKRTNWLIVVVLIVATVILSGTLGTAVSAINNLTRVFNAASGNGINVVLANPGQQANAFQDVDRINILVMGIDQRPGENPDQARTDTMILISIDPQNKTAGMLSIPRDLYVPLPDRNAQDRINTAHALGGPEYAMRTVEFNFGVPVHHYARLNFDAVVQIITYLGGVDVFVDQDINDTQYPDQNFGYDPFYLPAGYHHLDGATALKYMRTRHGASDFYRLRRQQQVIMALRDRILSSDALVKVVPNTPIILQSLRGAIDTSLNPAQIIALAGLVKDIPTDQIARVAIDETATKYWTTPQGASVLVPDRDIVRTLRDKLYTPKPKANAAQPAPTPDDAPQSGQIALQNGTLTVGLASGARTFLTNQGYIVNSATDAPQRTPTTIVIDYRRRPDYIRRLVTTLGMPDIAVIEAYDPNSTLDALIILGDDYVAK